MRSRCLSLVLATAALAACTASGTPSSSPSPSASQALAAFPTQVAGLPVVTAGHALELLEAGRLAGGAIAVAGYYSAFNFPCAMPGRYIGPLEVWCSLSLFSDTAAGAQEICRPLSSDSQSCQWPTGPHLSPFFVTETSVASVMVGGGGDRPAALVLIGHAGDPRQWECPSATQDQCAHAFVVDRVAWANGHDIPVAAPQTGSVQSGKAITPILTLAQVVAATGVADGLVLTAAPFRAGDIATIDPRWHFAGDSILWLVRSLGPIPIIPGAVETRPEDVWLVDDGTGKVISSHSLAIAPDYQPARWWPMATVHGYACCAGNLEAFSRVEAADGTVVYEGLVAETASGGSDTTTFGGDVYGSPPLVLPAGSYTITDWLANDSGAVMGTPTGQCSTKVTLRPLEDARLNAEFPSGHACTFGPAPTSSHGL
ncbi:MAG TPA: hypothetical protein VF494_05315 [Candidatus Limnocylindrales bacterium]